MRDLLTPDVVLDFYRPLVDSFEPAEGQPDTNGPPAMVGLLTSKGLVVGPVFGDFTDPSKPLAELHPWFLPDRPTVRQAVFAIEAVGSYESTDESDVHISMDRSDVILLWGADAETAWFAIAPLTRTWTTDEEGNTIAAVEFTDVGDPDRPPILKEYEAGEALEDKVLATLRSLVLKDPNTPPPNPGAYTLKHLGDNQEEAE